MIGPIAAKTSPANVARTSLSAPLPTSSPDSKTATVDPAVLFRDLAAARQQADALGVRLRDGAKANTKAARAAKIEQAKARLKALRLAVALKVVVRDGKGALKVAQEVSEVARDIRALRSDASATGGVTPLADPAAGTGEIPATAGEAAAGDDAALDSAVDGVLQTARQIVALARKAARPGSAEDRAIEHLQNPIGKPQVQTDIIGAADGGAGLDLKA